MSYNDEIGSRMKHNYEEPARTRLVRRMPVAIRIDGKAFHTFTRGLAKPFDSILSRSMRQTMLELCKNIQGCVFGYTQSDEITLILVDYKTLASEAWFDYEVQKMCSVAASMATNYFNRAFSSFATTWFQDFNNTAQVSPASITEEDKSYYSALSRCVSNGAMFDARCFNIPIEEVTNLVYWRQLDASKNSVQMLARAFFSHKQLQGKSCSELQDMLMTEKGINWNDVPTKHKRGAAAYSTSEGWIVDLEMPQLKGTDRQYVEKWINPQYFDTVD